MRLWSRWVELCARQERAEVIALVRIGGALAALHHVGSVVASGALEQVWARGGVAKIGSSWLDLVGGPTLENVSLVANVFLVAATCLLFGLATRPAAIVAWLTCRVLVRLNGSAGGSSEELITHTLLLLAVARSGGALSIDARVFGERSTPAWPRWVMTLQLVLMYTTTAMQKVSSSWVPGGPADALWYIYQEPQWTRIDITRMPWIFPLTQVATLGTWLFELAAPVLLVAAWARETGRRWKVDLRAWFLLYGVALHIVVHATMSVGAFSIATLALYPSAWSPDDLARLRARLLRRPLPGTSP